MRWLLIHYKSATVDSFGSQVIELLENSLRLLKNVCLLIKVVRFLQSKEHSREIVSEKRVRWKQVAEKNQESSSTSERRVARQWNASGRLWSKGTLLRLPVHMLDTDITKEKYRMWHPRRLQNMYFQSIFLSSIISFIRQWKKK